VNTWGPPDAHGRSTATTESDSGDVLLQCADCTRDFLFSAGEQRFFAAQGFLPPRRCRACRDQRRIAREREAQ
jgi:hypothetical protein